ncbi:cation:dicarboxylate symporter family transporter [Paenibacillus beijingensis]|uniref:Glutamate:protein symporter n=1 Tax=Paenibacillus beijingensis TaxID=1126833 RepID=A0A0D5NLS1_9BACL|nr:cation:dicarboxylase symporter family transporter [Paenibacillus beijingensis]AJY75878.1 glutamate:protein symporter [Paenibacillus beijingensis]
MKKKKIGLVWQIVIGLILGIAIGSVFYGNPAVSVYLKPIGDIFIRLIKMIVVPIVFSTLVVGIAGVGDIKKLGRLGGKTILYFEIVTTFAIVFGLLIANLFKPGKGVDMSHLSKGDIGKYVETSEKISHSMSDTFVNIVPSNIFQAFANGDLLAIVFFSVLFGLGVSTLGERGRPILQFFEGVSETMFWVTNQIMKFAPFGVFGLIGVTVSKFGVAALIPMGKLVLSVYIGMLMFVFVIFALIAKYCGTNIITIIKVLKDEIVLAFSTASSEAVLPKLIEKMEKFGCPKSISSFVIPTGYSFNLDGSTLYQAIATVFIAQMFGIDLPISSQILIVFVLMLTSKGMAGVPGASLVVLLATLSSAGLPIEGVAFITAIDRLLDMARTAVNVIGNGLAAIVMSKWERQFDRDKAQKYAFSLKAATGIQNHTTI